MVRNCVIGTAVQKDKLCRVLCEIDVLFILYCSSTIYAGGQTYYECCHIHWGGDFTDIPAPHYHLLSIITVSKDKLVNLSYYTTPFTVAATPTLNENKFIHLYVISAFILVASM